MCKSFWKSRPCSNCWFYAVFSYFYKVKRNFKSAASTDFATSAPGLVKPMGRWRSSDVWRFTARGCSARPRRMTVVLEISGLGKTYKSGHHALSDVDLSINKGTIFALPGPNGVGKTTMNRILCGLVTANAGTVTVAGPSHAQGHPP